MNKYRTANKQLIRDLNTTLVLQMVRERGPISRADISKETGLNPATVSSNLEPLLKHEIVRETGSGKSSGGRKPTLLALNPDARYVIGVDMGTTKVQAAYVNLCGEVGEKTVLTFAGRKSPDDVLAVMEDAVRQLLNAGGDEMRRRALGIGIGFHGLVDSERGVSLFAPAFQWKDVEVKRQFERTFSLPVVVDNDVRAMALAEKWFGDARELDDFMFLNIGTGIGSGLYAHGQLIQGSGYGAGEIGHIPLVDNGIRCYCGNVGCLHTVATGPAMEREARQRMNERDAPQLVAMSGGDKDRIDGEMIFRAAQHGDPLSIMLLHEAGKATGRVLAMAVNLLNPERIIVGGGVSQAGKYVLDSMKQEMVARSMHNQGQHVELVRTSFGVDAGIIGAGTLILSSFFNDPNRYLRGIES